jgi:biofilm PGA synthesis N-glycosyltransferase PgaC
MRSLPIHRTLEDTHVLMTVLITDDTASVAVAAGLFLIIAYTYAGYPLVLWLRNRLIPVRYPGPECRTSPENWPDVSIVITMHNGAPLIEPKLSNIAGLEYPGNLSVHFVLDGCTDDTQKRIADATSRGYSIPVFVHPSSDRNGKEAAIREAMPSIPGPVLMFSDADAALASDCVPLLVEKLSEDGVGVACGQEFHETSDSSGAGTGQGLFYRYEHAVKLLQSRVTSQCYVQGGVFAMWKRLYPPRIPLGATQDGAIAFHTVLSGHRVAYVPNAHSREPYHVATSADFARRVRTVSRSFYSICCFPGIFLPWRCGTYGYHVLFARLLRWMVVPIAVVANLLLILPVIHGNRLALGILVCELIWAILAFAGHRMEQQGRRWKLAYFCYYFSYIHLAAAMAVIRVLLGQRTAVWKPTN